MVVVICGLLAVSLLITLLSPFWLCDEGVLLPATIANNPEELKRRQTKLLDAYLADEEAYKQGAISQREWQIRQRYLGNRYVDLGRRLQHLSRLGVLLAGMAGMGIFLGSAPLEADEASIARTLRHIVLVNADLDTVWGQYFFAVHNKSNQPQRFRSEVMLPRETVDFQALEGLTAENLQLDHHGKIFLEKEFAPGISLLSIGFQTKVAKFSRDQLTFVAPFAIGEFSLASTLGSGVLVSNSGAREEFSEGLPAMLSSGTYRGILSKDLAAGALRRVEITGIPKERNYLYLVAIIFTVILAGSALYLLAARGVGR